MPRICFDLIPQVQKYLLVGIGVQFFSPVIIRKLSVKMRNEHDGAYPVLFCLGGDVFDRHIGGAVAQVCMDVHVLPACRIKDLYDLINRFH